MPKRRRDGSVPAGPSPSALPEWMSQLPPITRKITACTACRKQKIKCRMPNDTVPCERCSRKGIACVLNKSLQALLDDQKHTELIRHDVRNLHETLSMICREFNIENPPQLLSNITDAEAQIPSDGEKDGEDACELTAPPSPSAVQAPMDTFLEAAKHTSPISADSMHTPRQKRTRQPDLVDKGIISLPVAEQLVESYMSQLDPYLYGIASHYQDVREIRRESPVLFAAICTVSALHNNKDQSLYEVCNIEYRRLVSRSLFEKANLEHIRALCVGSFWLADASRILASDAVRRAADLRLHRNLYRILYPENQNGIIDSTTTSEEDARDRTRLWYLLFVCDQHLSILHNRDGLFRHDKEILVNWELYLDHPGTSDSDIRILSQVSLLLIMSQVRDAFGSEHAQKVHRSLSVQLNLFSRQLDEWFAKFTTLFKPNAKIGDFPQKGLKMHYQFGRLYLGQHVFRGLKGDPIPMHFMSAASMARDAAVTIFEMLLSDTSLQDSMVGVPHYFHIMIAFAGHFLLEVCEKYAEQLSIDLDAMLQLMGKVLSIFTQLPAIPQHPICRMSAGLGRKVLDCATNMGRGECLLGTLNLPELNTQHLSTLAQGDRHVPLDSVQVSPGHLPLHPMHQMPPPINDFYADFTEFQFPDISLNFVN